MAGGGAVCLVPTVIQLLLWTVCGVGAVFVGEGQFERQFQMAGGGAKASALLTAVRVCQRKGEQTPDSVRTRTRTQSSLLAMQNPQV